MLSLREIHEELLAEIRTFEGQISFVIGNDEEEIHLNDQIPLSPASTIKVPILVEALRCCDQGKLSLNQLVEIKSSDKVGGSGVLQAMDASAISLRDLLTLMIIVSDNTATNKVIELVGFEQLNDGFRQIGLSSTALNRKMMDLEKIQFGIDNVTTANDLYRCLRSVDNETVLSKDSRKVFYEIMEAQQFQHKLPFYMDKQRITILNKTGSIAGVENDCGIFRTANRTIYAAVLCNQLLSEHEGIRFIQLVGKKISKLIEQ